MMSLDKQAHFLAGAVIALALGYLVPPLVGFAVAVLVGAAKEVYDSFHTDIHTVDGWDFMATGAGALAAAGFILATQHQVLILY
jgi:hypothetical protein